MQLINKFDKGIRFLLSIIDIYSEYAWVFPLKGKKCITITNAFQEIVDKANCKRNKIWVYKGCKFYNRSMKSWLLDNDVECIRHIMKGNLLFLKDLLKPETTKFTNI